jgi:anti-anti-sigma factor
MLSETGRCEGWQMTNETLTMNVQEDAESGFRVLSLSGPLVLRTLFEFQNEVRAANPNNLILDLTNVEYMESAGLGAILGAFASYQRQGKRLLVVGANRRVRTLFEVTHTEDYLTRFDTLEEAKLSRAGTAG